MASLWRAAGDMFVGSCVGLQEEEEEEPQTALPMSFSWASRITASVLT